METIETPTIDDKTINTINALLNMSDLRGATEHEAANATTQVMRLLAKHNLSMAEFDKIANPVEDINTNRLQEDGQSIPRWKTNLLNSIAHAHFCDLYLTHGYRATTHVLVGRGTNVQAVKIVYSFLCDVVDSEAKAALKAYEGWEHGKAYSNSFRLGMVSRISTRLRDEEKKIHDEQVVLALGTRDGHDNIASPDHSIVVKNMYDEAQKEIHEYYKSVGIRLRSGTYSGSNRSNAGWNSGYAAGANVPLNASPSLKARN